MHVCIVGAITVFMSAVNTKAGFVQLVEILGPEELQVVVGPVSEQTTVSINVKL